MQELLPLQSPNLQEHAAAERPAQPRAADRICDVAIRDRTLYVRIGYQGVPDNEDDLSWFFFKDLAEPDKRIVELTRQWSLELDPAKRKTIIGELQKIHLENVTYVPVGQYRSVIAYRKNLKGMIASPPLFYWNVEKD